MAFRFPAFKPLLDAVRAEPRRFLDPFTLVTAVCLAAGLWMRVRGMLYDVSPLWLDEAAWAIRLVEEPLFEQYIRPLGFVAVAKALVQLFGMYELSLRFLPWAAGIAAMVLALPLSRRLFQAPGARLLFVAVIALHPAAIDHAKEFKPYSLSLGLHVACALFAITYYQTERPRWLVATLACAGLGILFAQDLVFVCPSVYLLAGYLAWKNGRKRELVGLAASALATAGLLLALYFLMWRHIGAGAGSEETAYWSRKYDVFFVEGKSEGGKLGWTLRKYLEMAAFPGYRDQLWGETSELSSERLDQLMSANAWSWWFLNLAGLVTLLVRRKYAVVLLFGLPLLVMLAFNWVGFWPFGVFRTNLFVLLQVTALAAAALDHALPKLVALLPTAALLLLPFAVFERGFHEGKQLTLLTDNSAMPDAVRAAVALQGKVPEKPEPLVLDPESCDPWLYYTEFHPTHREFARENAIERRFETKCYNRVRRGGIYGFGRRFFGPEQERLWFVIKRVKDQRHFPRKLPPSVRVIGERWVGFDESTRVLGLRYFPEDDESRSERRDKARERQKRRKRRR